ncbi:MAG: saccharopine dehydrogenase family protein [Solirubrobacteraceae bacterium]
MAEREHDIVLFGATGFTGALTAEYLVQNAPEGTRVALAGRNMEKLTGVRDRVSPSGPGNVELPLLRADVTDVDSLRAIAESAKVVITTVGPYIRYGEPLVAACAAAGTHYVDLTGEPLFVDLMWLHHHEAAERSGAKIVHSCGFDSIPYDLVALFTVNQLPQDVPIKLEGFVRVGGTFSGGTFQSALEIMGRLGESVRVARQRRQQEPKPVGRRVRGVAGAPHRDGAAGGWAIPFPTIDPQTVLRSAGALERYGPDFSYSHYLVVRRLPVLAGMAAGAGTVVTLAQFPPARRAMMKIKASGDGPSQEQRAKSWFKVRMVGEGGGQRVITEVSGGDPGYTETSKMLSEAALCLAHDDLPERSGQLTPAVAMGQPLIDRLSAAGIEFRTVEHG